MKVFLIILGVIVLLTVLILSLSAEFTIILDEGWTTRIKVLFIEKDIELSKILSFILFPEKAAENVAEEMKEKEKNKEAESNKDEVAKPKVEAEKVVEKSVENETATTEDAPAEEEQPAKAPAKPNPIQKIWNDDGIVGIMLLVSNLLQTVNSAVTTLIKGLHIYSLYVKIIVGGGDAADIGQLYGTITGVYYPIKGMILNGMRVDQYDDYVMPDFIAPKSEYGFQFIGSINIFLLVKVLFKAGKVFIVNLIKNK